MTVSYGPKGSVGNCSIVPVNEYCEKYYSEFCYVLCKKRAVNVILFFHILWSKTMEKLSGSLYSQKMYITYALFHAAPKKFAENIKDFGNGCVHDQRNNVHVENEILGGRITCWTPVRNVACYCVAEFRAANSVHRIAVKQLHSL
jgi:hypothetical protein